MTTATKKIADETSITEIVKALRAQKHLIAEGFLTLGDVRLRGLDQATRVKYVGPASVEQLQAAVGVQPTPAASGAPVQDEREENGMPVLLERTPTGPSHIAFCPANKIPGPGGAGFQIQKPVFVEFDSKGHARVTARMFFMRKFRRDESRCDEAIDEGRPWRSDCVKVLRSFSAHGTGFIVLAD